MGIPSYFQYIIKNYKTIFDKKDNIEKNGLITNLYLDSNSIIYDVLRRLQKEGKDIYKTEYEKLEIERKIYNGVCLKIEEYISRINPTGVVIVAFDGIAPLAKLEQQRTRRFKSEIIKDMETEIERKIGIERKDEINSIKWNQTSITPGTEFMDNLDIYIKGYFNNEIQKNKYKTKKIIISGSSLEEDKGEGEHKIFDFIRKNKEYHKKTITYIYGLDADLIILCLNHLYISNNIYLFREIEDYQKEIKEIYEDSDAYSILNIDELSKEIVNEMVDLRVLSKLNEEERKELEINKIHDYIFLSFILGNDFLPHNPVLNIRSVGLDVLMKTYKKVIGNKESICNKESIKWKTFRKLIDELKNIEEELFIKESIEIKKYSKREFLNNKNKSNVEYLKERMMNYPVYNRDKELYINPLKSGWRTRYYNELLDIYDYKDETGSDENKEIKRLCYNYLEGLEWVLRYYSVGCVNTLWSYKYNYPPLFSDLLKYIPYFDEELVKKENYKISKYTQLSYVVPYGCLYLLPKEVENHMKNEYKDMYDNQELETAYSKYLWEAHIKLMDVDILELDKNIRKLVC